jgi:heat shock protein HslJ
MNKEWVVVEMEKENVDSLSMDQRPTIKFSKEMVSGSASCNRFHGTYNMEGNTLTFGQIATTKMYCQTTDNIEKTYLKALSDVRTWEYKQERLYFFNQEKKIIIIYKEL